MSWEIQTIDRLDVKALSDLREERVAAIRVPRYCSPIVADRIARFLIEHPDRTNYRAQWKHAAPDVQEPKGTLDPTDVDRVGWVDHSFQTTSGPSDVVDMMRAIRAVVAPALAPIDRLRLELDEIVPLGSELFRKNGRISLAGIGRIMESSQNFVHADTGRHDCLTANVYLRMPEHGGGTRIWRYDGDYRHSPRSYHFADGEIPESVPSCLFEPEVGDLVIWNPILPHAVLPFDDPPRVTLQTWLLIDKPGDRTAFSIRLLN